MYEAEEEPLGLTSSTHFLRAKRTCLCAFLTSVFQYGFALELKLDDGKVTVAHVRSVSVNFSFKQSISFPLTNQTFSRLLTPCTFGSFEGALDLFPLEFVIKMSLYEILSL